MAQADPPGAGFPHFNVLVAQDFGTTGFMEAHCFRHVQSPIHYSNCKIDSPAEELLVARHTQCHRV
jgi:hypothetical protein